MNSIRNRFRLLVIAAVSATLMGLPVNANREHSSAFQFVGPEATEYVALPNAGMMTYRVDAQKSQFTVRAFVGGLLSSFGHDHTISIRDFTGEAQVTPDTVAPGSLHLTIKAGSLVVVDKVSDSDRNKIETTMRQEVLETEKHPEIVFRSTRVEGTKIQEGQYQVKIWGDLTLHGVTRSIVIGSAVSFASDHLRARGSFAINQSEYNIKRVSVAGGTIKVKDQLKFTFDIVAYRQS